MQLAAQIGEQAKVVNRNPTDGQKEAGNYKKGHVRVHGLDITIENPRGSYRSGVDPESGKPWRSRLPHHYGYIRRTDGADGQHVDVYLGPHLKSPDIYVIDQLNVHSGRDFDEHKVFIGFGSMTQVREAYHRAFSDGRGKERIGHIARMGVGDFKDWLRDGNTKAPIRRAAGGGVPSFEETSEVPPFDQTEPIVDNGRVDALARGAVQGATFNFGDEIAGARAAGPSWVPDLVGPLPARTLVGAARTGINTLRGEPTPEYDKARDEFRKADEQAKKAHPYYHGAGEFLGAVPSMAAVPEAGMARALAPTAGRLAKFGAGALDAATQGGIYGGASGAGEGTDLGSRAVEGAKGIVSGIVGGGLAHGASETMRAAYDKFGKPVVGTIRGWFDNEGEAARRIANTLASDQQMIVAGKAQGMPWADWVAARQRGEPVTLADLGSARTQELLRSAANTSPEARAQLEKVIEGRFLQQSERVGDTVRGLVPGGANARKTGDQLVAEYDAGRVPAYKAAYDAGDRPIMSPAMERLMSSDTFVGAMKRAISSGKDRDVAHGLGGFNPMVNVTPDGRIVFNKGAQGVPTYPNLQYWDQVKRELDSVANQAKRSGDTASVAGDLAKVLRNELDAQVPVYSKARGVAEQYFGESNALEAGRKLAGKRADPNDVALAMRQMKPDERSLFQEGYASDLAERVIGNIRDTRDLTKAIFATPNERKMLATVFGPGGVQQVQNRMALEVVMDAARKAMGNSTTARQLISAGLAGGALGGAEAYYSGDPLRAIEGFGVGAGARIAGGKYLASEVGAGARRLIGKVDAKTANHVGALLTSDDPRLLRRGVELATKTESIGRAFRTLANRIALAGQAQGRGVASETMGKMMPYRGPNLGALQGPAPGRAGDEQQQPEGVVNTQP